MHNSRTLFLFSSAIVVIDQSIKYFARTNPILQDGVFIIQEHIGLKYFHNTNLALSIPFSNSTALVLMLSVLCVLGVVMWKHKDMREHVGMYLILAGAFSNVVDRIFFGGVIDYVVIPFGGIINLADVSIVLGAGWLLFSTHSKEKHPQLS